jgi:sodium-dependent phosphate cotransporter
MNDAGASTNGAGRKSDLFARLGWPARAVLFLASLILFALSLLLVKEGATPLASLIRSGFSVNNAWDALGLGWLAAMFSLSGSPVAATSLALFQAGVLDPIQTFSMIAGSRLGAAFVVLLVGFVYSLRHGTRESSLGAGLLSLLVTHTVFVMAILLGLAIFYSGLLERFGFMVNGSLVSPLDSIFSPLLATIQSTVPRWGLFPIGFILMLTTFWMFDRALPTLHVQGTGLERINRLLFRPGVSFLLGAGITALTMSVSVSLSMLIPLSNRGFIRQENITPYIMGSNVTTFIDTLIAAGLLANPEAVTIVLVQMLSTSLISLAVLFLAFPTYDRLLARLTHSLLTHRWQMVLYIALTIGIPIGLLVFI